ncbi:MAG: histone deacetylase family protein [Verrucomicrobia bacterium]|nr:histone deacetylase family protein [Verrucomicrobiota bacterium]
MHLVYSPRCLEYAAPGHPESPDRLRWILAALPKDQHTWLTPEPCAEEDILRVHTAEMLNRVRTGAFYDGDTPSFPNIYELARLSAGAAILASEQAIAGRKAFALVRPPGHHATRDRVMGFCYFNNIAIAVARLTQRTAILDFDCHHGNGTEDIFYRDKRVLYVSLHQFPCYPGTGAFSQANCRNYPLPPGTEPSAYLAALDKSLDEIRAFKPELLALSAGFDSYKGDPITSMGLEIETFGEIGRRIAALKVPAFATLEGGYAPELGKCVAAFVDGWESVR